MENKSSSQMSVDYVKGKTYPKVGFIGVGTIAEALIMGMSAHGEPRAEILLSPRNAKISSQLSAKFPFVTVAEDNQGVVDGSDIVFLAIRPQIAEETLRSLIFHPHQLIVSLIATFNIERLKPLLAPANQLFRATPLPAVADRKGVLTLHPPSPEISALLNGLGRLIQISDEQDMDTFWAATALMGTYFGFMGSVADWLTHRGVSPQEARNYVGAMFQPLAETAVNRAEESFEKLVVDHSTAGGLNEQAFRELKANGWTAQIGDVLDLIHDRISGRATFETRLANSTSQASLK